MADKRIKRLETPDTEFLIKNLIYFIIFAIAIIVVINSMVMSRVERYKMSYFDYKNQASALDVTTKKLEELEREIRAINKSESKNLETIKIELDKNALDSVLAKFFYNIEIQKISDITNSGFRIQEFSVQGATKTLSNILDFFEFLKNPSISLKLSIPFRIQKQDDGFFISFSLQNFKAIEQK